MILDFYCNILVYLIYFFFFQAEDGIRDLVRSRGLGDVYKRQILILLFPKDILSETLKNNHSKCVKVNGY